MWHRIRAEREQRNKEQTIAAKCTTPELTQTELADAVSVANFRVGPWRQ